MAQGRREALLTMKLSPVARYVGVAVVLGCALVTGLALRPASTRVDGEYGLWVEDRRDSLVVHWLSADSAPGSLAIEADTRKEQFTTPRGTAHTIAFARPRSATVTLVYGTAASVDTTTLALQYPRRAAVATGADTVFVLGDTHGEFDTVVKTLQQSGLIDNAQRWTGNRRHLVFVGDLTDRGEEVVPLLWLVYRLEQEAARAGGRVHVVLGNHETMVWMNDLRYVAKKEQSIAAAHGVAYDKMFDSRETVLGRWLATKPIALRLDNILFAHGGVSAAYLKYTPQTLDDTLAKFMKEDWFYKYGDTAAFRKVAEQMDSATYAQRASFFQGDQSVLWYRSYVLAPDTALASLEAVLSRFGATVHVVGHTPTTMVHQKYGGRLIAAHPRTPGIEMVLLIRNGRTYDRFRIDQAGARMPLPSAN